MKLNWVTKEHNIAGNALGYNHHNSMMKKFSELYFDYSDNADIALHIAPADFFIPIPGKVNVLFTMFEFDALPNNYIQRIQRADALIVPSRFCRDLFRKYYNGKIYVCHEGVDPSKYEYFERSEPVFEKFRFLWVGAPNPRKGYPVLLEIIKFMEKYPKVEIYLKTTTQKTDRKKYVQNLWKNRRRLRQTQPNMYREMLRRSKNPDVSDQLQVHGRHKNIIWDSRKLPFDDLIALYNSAHCFVLPTFGEGWGLTLCEAMATGCPSIATAVTGCADYFDESVGYEIPWTMHEQELENYDVKCHGYVPSTQGTLDRMFDVMRNYSEAVKRGRKASDRILNKFTWHKAAKRLKEIIKDVEKNHIISAVDTISESVSC